MTPSLSTTRLALRPLKKATVRQVEWLNNPDVVRFSEQRHRQHSLSSQLRYVSSFGGKSHIWAICLIESGEHIGNLTTAHDEANNVSDVGIMVGETSLWGKGFASEAWIAGCNWLLDPGLGGVRKLECGCMKPNEAMTRLARKSKFTIEGERLNRFVSNGGPVSSVLFGRHR